MQRSDRDGTDGVATYRSSGIDRALAGSRTISVTGPLAPVDVDEVRRRLAAAWTPRSRLTLVPDPAARTWMHDNGLAPAVTERPDLADLPVGEIVTRLRDRTGVPPLDVLLCGPWLVIDHSHGMGDGRLGLEQIAGLVSRSELPMAQRFERSLPDNAAWQAVRRHVLRHPRRVREILRLRADNAAVPAPQGSHREIADWRAARRAVTATMPRERLADLREAVDETEIRMSSAAVTVALWRAALEAEGVQLDDRIQILFDCRRYLDPAHAEDHGNFAVGIPIRFGPGAGPVEIGERIRAVAESGWPAVVLAAGELRARLRPRTVAPEPESAGPGDRLRLSVSDLGRVRIFDDLAWHPTAAQQHLFAYIEPDGPDAATVLVAEVGGARHFTSVFCADYVDVAKIEAALARLCHDPAALLRGLLGGA